MEKTAQKAIKAIREGLRWGMRSELSVKMQPMRWGMRSAQASVSAGGYALGYALRAGQRK